MKEPLLRAFSPKPSPFLRGLVACTGTDFCNLAQIETKKLGVELSKSLEQRLGTKGNPLTMHWSGCPAGCGNHQVADIGFRGTRINVGGKIVDAVAIYVGGRTGPDAVAGQQVLDAVPCDDKLVDVVANLVADLRSCGQKKPDAIVCDPALAGTGTEAAPAEMVTMPTLSVDGRSLENNLDAPRVGPAGTVTGQEFLGGA